MVPQEVAETVDKCTAVGAKTKVDLPLGLTIFETQKTLSEADFTL